MDKGQKEQIMQLNCMKGILSDHLSDNNTIVRFSLIAQRQNIKGKHMNMLRRRDLLMASRNLSRSSCINEYVGYITSEKEPSIEFMMDCGNACPL